MKVIVASKNPVKITASQSGFEKMFPTETIECIGSDSVSGVSDQPMTDAETLKGAENRVESIQKIEADFWVGIEGGLDEKDDEMQAFAWIVIHSKEGKIGKSRTGMFVLPHKLAELIKQGMELGDADDKVFGLENSKQKSGTVGTLTKNVSNRTEYYEQAVVLALIPFVNEELY